MKIHVYILRRILMVVPALFGITTLTFLLINLAPGSPIDQKLDQIRFGSGAKSNSALAARGPRGVSQHVIDALKKQYGFDKPLHIRYLLWLKNIARLDFGQSYIYGRPVLDVIVERFLVSLQFGVASFVLSYLVALTLGLTMARCENRWPDRLLGGFLLVSSTIPPFVMAVLLLVVFAGGSFLNLFPLGYLQSGDYDSLSTIGKILDRIHHFILPLTAYMMGSFTGLTYLCRNCLLDELKKDYIRMARAMGISEFKIYFEYALRNVLVPMVTGMGSFLAVFFSGSLLVETIFQLDGIGLLGFSSLMARDYNVIMGLTFLQSVALLFGNLLTDLINSIIDPRIDYGQGAAP